MAHEMICDGCRKREVGKKAGKGWRTLVLDRGYLDNCAEFGSVDEVCEFLLCGECDDLLDHDKVQLALVTAINRAAPSGDTGK